MKEAKIPRSLWPFALIGYFVIAIVGLTIFIAWAVHQKVDLVRDDYYAEEVQFQRQFERVARTQQLNADAQISYDAPTKSITLKLPASARASTVGRIYFYRPSDASLDRRLKLSLNDNGTQIVDAGNLKAGLWKVRLQWNASGSEFYSEKTIVISNGNS